MASLSKQRDAHLTLPVLRPEGPEVEDKDEAMPGDLAELFLQSQSTLVTHLDVISTGGNSIAGQEATANSEQQQNMECRILELSDPVLLNHVLILPLGARLGTIEGKTDSLTALEVWANDFMPILQPSPNEDVHTNFLRAARNRRLTYNRGAIPGSTVYTPPTARWRSGGEVEEFPDFLLTTRLTLRGCYKTLTVCVLGHLKVDAKKLITKTIEYVASRLPLAMPSAEPSVDIYFARSHPMEDAQGRYRPRQALANRSNVITDLRYKVSALPTLTAGSLSWTLLGTPPPSGALRPELSREVLLLMQAIQQSGRCPVEPMIWRFWDIIIELVNASPLGELQSRRAHFETTLSRWMSDPELDSVAEAMATLIQLIFVPPNAGNSEASGGPPGGGMRPDERLSTQSQERLARVVAIYFTQSHRIHKLPDGGQSLVLTTASVLTDATEFKPRTLRTALLELIFVLVSANPRLLSTSVIEILDGSPNNTEKAPSLTGVDSQDVVDGLDCLKALYHAKEALLSRNYDALIQWVVALSAGFGVSKEPLDLFPSEPAPATEMPLERAPGQPQRRVVMQQQQPPPTRRPMNDSPPPAALLWRKKSGTDPFLFVSHRLILGRYPDDYRARDVLRLPPFFVELFAQTEFLSVKGRETPDTVAKDIEQLQRIVNYLVLNIAGATVGLSDELLTSIAPLPIATNKLSDVSPLFLFLHMRHRSLTLKELEVLSSRPNGLLALSLYLAEASLLPNQDGKMSYMVLLNIIEGLSRPEVRRLVFGSILQNPSHWDEWFPSTGSNHQSPLRIMPEDLDLRPDQFFSKIVKATALLDGPEHGAEILEALIEYTGADSSYTTECDASIRKAAGLSNSLEIGDIANAKTRVLGGFERGGRVVIPNVFCKIDERINARAQSATLSFLDTMLTINLNEITRASNYRHPHIGGSLFIGPLLHLEKFSLSQFFPPIRYLSPDQTTRLLGLLRRSLAFSVSQNNPSLSPSSSSSSSLTKYHSSYEISLSLLKKFSQYGVWDKHREMDNDIWCGVKCLMIEATNTLNVELLEGCLQFLRSYILQTHPTIRWWLFNRIVLELRGTVELDKLCFTVLRAVYDDEMILQLHPNTSKVDWTLTISPHQPPIMPNHVTPTMLETQAGVLLCLSAPSSSTRLLLQTEGGAAPGAPSAAPSAPSAAPGAAVVPDEAMLLRIAGETLEFDPIHRNIPLEHRLYICAMLPSHHYKDINSLRISMLSDKARVYSTSVFGGTVDIYDRDSLTWTVIKQLIGKNLCDHVTPEFWQSAITSELSIEGITSMLDRIVLILSDSNDEGLVQLCNDLLTVLVQSKLPLTQLLTERVKMLAKFYDTNLKEQVYPRIERLLSSIMIALCHTQKGTDLSSLIHTSSDLKKNRKLAVLTLVILCQLYPLVLHQAPLTFSLMTSIANTIQATLQALHNHDDDDDEEELKNDLELTLLCVQMLISNKPLQILLTSNLNEQLLDFISPHIVNCDSEALAGRGHELLEINSLPSIGNICAKFYQDNNIKNAILKIIDHAPQDITYALFSIDTKSEEQEHHDPLIRQYLEEMNLNNLPKKLTQRTLKDMIPNPNHVPLNLSRCLDIVRQKSIQLKEYKVEFGVFDSFFPDPTRWLLPPRYVAVAKSGEERNDDKSVDIMARSIFQKSMSTTTAPLIIPMESLEDPDVMETTEDGNTRQKRSISAKAAKLANTNNAQQLSAGAAEDWTTYQYIASTMQQQQQEDQLVGGYGQYDPPTAPGVAMDSWDQLIESAPQHNAWGDIGGAAAAQQQPTPSSILYSPTILTAPPPAPPAKNTMNLPPLNFDELMEDPMCRELANRDGFRDLILDCAQHGINFVGLLRDPATVRQNPALYSQFLTLAQNHELTHGLLRMSGIL